MSLLELCCAFKISLFFYFFYLSSLFTNYKEDIREKEKTNKENTKQGH
jgi:uncharacterized membrane protein